MTEERIQEPVTGYLPYQSRDNPLWWCVRDSNNKVVVAGLSSDLADKMSRALNRAHTAGEENVRARLRELIRVPAVESEA